MAEERTGETKNLMLGAAVTPTEKRFAELAATVRGASVSNLLRELTVSQLIEEGRAHAAELATKAGPMFGSGG